jgi:hypothetical protein
MNCGHSWSMGGASFRTADVAHDLFVVALADRRSDPAGDVVQRVVPAHPFPTARATLPGVAQRRPKVVSGSHRRAASVSLRWSRERDGFDEVARERIGALYQEFCKVNDDLKEIITAWQMRDDSTVNDHTDADYDEGVLARLTDLHRRALPVVRGFADGPHGSGTTPPA